MVRPGDITLAEFLHSVYVPAKLGLRPGSIEQLAVAVVVLDHWHGSPVTLSHLSDRLLQRFLADYVKQHHPATVNSKRRAILTLWRFAYDEGLVNELPRRVPKLKEPLRLPEAWTVSEVERIICEARQVPGVLVGSCYPVPKRHFWPALLLAVYESGGRIGAVRQVRPCDVSLADRYMIFRAETQKDFRPKFCPLGDQAIAAIAAIYSEHCPLVWPWPYSREWLERSFKKILHRAGVRYGRGRGGLFHKLRRTSGSLVEANGGDGSRHLGNSRAVFNKHYRDPRVTGGGQLDRLPRLNLPDESPQLWLPGF